MSPFHFYSIQALPSINERIVFFGTYTGNKKDEQFIAFVSIGSLGLGSIKIYHDPKIQTNRDSQDQDAKKIPEKYYKTKLSYSYKYFILLWD